MQVPMTSNFTYMKSKNPPRIGRGYQPPRRVVDERGTEAHILELCTIEGRKRGIFMLFYVLYVV